MITTEGLTKLFDDFLAVEDVSFHVSVGQVMVLLGPNGAGKTTTVRMLTGVLVPSRGRAEVAGYDVVQHPDEVRARVGVLTEHHGLYGRMNAREYLEFYGSLYGLSKSTCRQRSDVLLERFGLAEAYKKRLSEYSKGMRQKLALVRALLHEPPVLLLDEPTSAMDPESARVVRDAIQSLRSSERTIILCTHNLAEADALADQVAIIRRGRIVLNGPVEQLKRETLGPPEYEAHFAASLDGYDPLLPGGARVVERSTRTLRFAVDEPAQTNPQLLERLIRDRMALVSFAEAPRSLEQVYLQVMEDASRRETRAN